jgi:FixJ family two-component response regulator
VLDYKMPAMNGLEVLARLRDRHIFMPTLLITSHADPALRDRAAAAGIRRVVEKPLSDSVLIDSIRDALGAAERRPT